jgi:hypothetical protein
MATCVPFQFEQPFSSFFFDHAMSKTCQYTTNDSKFCVGMKKLLLKNEQFVLQKTIIWIKKSNKGRKVG